VRSGAPDEGAALRVSPVVSMVHLIKSGVVVELAFATEAT
jgi:hypothetical protein